MAYNNPDDPNNNDWFDQMVPAPGNTGNNSPFSGQPGYPFDPNSSPLPWEGGPDNNPNWDPTAPLPTTPDPNAPTPAPTPTTYTGGGGSPYGPLNQPYGGSMPSVPQYTPPPFSFDDFTGPDAFAPPSAQSVLDNDPGYDFRLGQGKQALEQSAAARGTLNTGGTLQDLVNYGQGFASNEYGNAYNRALGTYQTNFSDALNSYITRFGSALTKYNTNYGTQYQTPFNQLMQQYGVNNSNYQNAQDRSFGQQFATATA